MFSESTPSHNLLLVGRVPASTYRITGSNPEKE